MRGAILLSVAALFCGLAGVSEATTCTSATLSTCEKSLYMTGKCVDGVCECISSDYTPGPFGCQEKQKAEITADFNGELQTGATTSIGCSAGIGTDTYKWYKDGAEDAETSDTFTFTTAAADMSGDYTCKSMIAGILSEESDVFTVTVASTFTTKLEVTGMPSAAVTGDDVRLTCKTGPHYAATSFTWFVDGGEVVGETTSTYARTLEAGDAGNEVKCSLTNAVESLAVTFPDSFASDIEGVEINALSSTTLIAGEVLSLSCEQTGGFPDLDIGILSYEWKKDGSALSSPVTTQLLSVTVDSASGGSYTCEATIDGNPAKVSPAVTVTIKDTMAPGAVLKSSTSQLTAGYFTLTCGYDIVNTLLPVTYKWYRDSAELIGVTDNILQFNGATSDLDGPYSCTVTGADGTVGNTAVSIAFDASSEIGDDTPTLTVPTYINAGETLTFTCGSLDYYTPGVSFIWTVGTTIQDGEVTNTFEYKPETTDPVDIKCAYSFDSQTSTEDSETINPKYIQAVTVQIEDTTSATLKPVAGSNVKLECDVTKSDAAGTVTYQWKDSSTNIDGETSKYYEFEAGAAGDAKTITCEVAAKSETEESDPVSVTSQATAETPSILRVPSDATIKREAEVDLYCISTSHAEDATFEWSKGGSVLSSVTTFKYTIDEVAEADDGDYTCKITVGGQTSDASEIETIATAVNEQTCTLAGDCVQSGNPFLDATACYDGKCNCQSGYAMKGGVCSGAVAVMGSLLMIVCAVLTHRMF